MSALRAAGGELALLAAGRAGLLAASVVSVHAATTALGPQQMGTVHLVIAAGGLAALVVAGCSHFFYRQAMSWQLEGTLATNLQRYAFFLAASALLAAAAVFALPAHVRPVAGGWLALLVAGNVLVTSLQQCLLHLVNMQQWRLAYVLLSNAVAWGGLALAHGLVQQFGGLAVHWMSGLLLAQLAVLLVTAALLAAERGQPAPPVVPMVQPAAAFTARPVFAFAWPLMICLALHWVQRSLPLLWLADTGSPSQVGVFSVGFSVGMLAMLAFDTLFKELYGPRYERELAHAAQPARVLAWERYAAAFFPAALAACICTVAASPALLRVLTAPAFHGAAAFVALGAVGQLLLSWYSLVMLQAAAGHDNRVLLLPNAAGALAACALLQWELLPDASMQAALAVIAGLSVTTASAAWRVRRLHAAVWPWRRMLQAAAAALPAWWLTQLAVLPVALAGVALLGLALQLWLARGWWPGRAAR